MTNIKASQQTVAEILASYKISVGTTPASMPKVSLEPSVSTQQTGSVNNPDEPLLVYGESSDKQFIFVLGGIKDPLTQLTAYAVISASKHDPNAVPQAYLSLLALIGGGVGVEYDIGLDYVGTGLATGTFSEANLDALNENLKKLAPNCPISFPGKGIEGTPGDRQLKETPGFAFLTLTFGAGLRIGSAHGSVDSTILIPYLGVDSEPSWTDLGVSLKGLYLRRIGITYKTIAGAFQFVVWLDGTYSFGGKPDDKGNVEGDGVTFELLDFHLGITTNPDYSWSFAGGWPDGLGLNYVKGPVQIGGGFAVIHDRGEYDFLAEGGLALSIPGLNFEILGAYARAKSGENLADYPLVFFYLLMQLASTTQGAPPDGIEVFPGVMLTGFCFGGGMNCQLHVPDPAKVLKFPLVTPLMAGGQIPNSPLEVVNNLTMPDQDLHLTWVTPQDGGFWLAAGLAANIVEVFNIWGLVVVSIPQGGDWSAALIGTLDMVSFKGIFKVKAAVEAEISSQLVAVGATLAPGSYLFSDDFVTATGGIDLYVYIGGTNKGQWVLTAGGYPPTLNVPGSYPLAPPRIGASYSLKVLNGKVDFEVAARGYLMISNVGLAAGASLDFSLSGKVWKIKLKLYFSIGMDFQVQWSPFHASIDVSVKLGIYIKLYILSKRFEVSIKGTVWMPPFGGKVRLDLPFGIHPSIPFGSQPLSSDWLSWDQFVTKMLPSDGRMLAKVESGMLPVPRTPDSGQKTLAVKGSDSTDTWNVSIHGFTFSTHCVVPSTDITVNGSDQLPINGKGTMDHSRALHVRPMGPDAKGLTSNHVVTITHVGVGPVDLAKDGWSVQPVSEGVPEALWGTSLGLDEKPDLTSGGLLDAYTGVRVTVPDAKLGHDIPPINVNTSLGYETVPNDSDLPISPTATTPTDQPNPTTNPNAISTITTTITTTSAAARHRLDTALQNSKTLTAGTQDYSPHTNNTLTHFQTRITQGLYTTNPLTV